MSGSPGRWWAVVVALGLGLVAAFAPLGGSAARRVVVGGPPCCSRRMSVVASARNGAQLVAEKVFETVEDVTTHLRRGEVRNVDDTDVLSRWTDEEDGRPRVLVLGSGWAAHAFAKIIDTDKFRVLIVSPRAFFIFTPMLPGSSMGTVEFRSILEPIRSANPTISYLEGTCTSLDPAAKRCFVDPALGPPEQKGTLLEIGYDKLVYAVGVKVSDFGVPGVAEHCIYMKELTDAQRVRVGITENLEKSLQPGLSTAERRRLVSFVVIGGGPTGIELSGELGDFVRDAVRRAYPQLEPLVKITLVHSSAELLPQFDGPLRRQACESLEERGVDVRLNTRCTRVEADFIELTMREANGSERVERLPTGLTAWTAGTGPRELTLDLMDKCGEAQRQAREAQKTPRGKIAVDAHLRVVGAQDILALGDATAVVSTADDPLEDACLIEGFLPQTAQVAAQQGAYAARLLNRGYDLSKDIPEINEPTLLDRAFLPLLGAAAGGTSGAEGNGATNPFQAKQFAFLNLGLLAYLGGGKAISQVQLGDKVLLQQAGSVGFLLWRSVYIVKQVALRNRVLVLFDWVKSTVFGRDTTRI